MRPATVSASAEAEKQERLANAEALYNGLGLRRALKVRNRLAARYRVAQEKTDAVFSRAYKFLKEVSGGSSYGAV